MEKKSPVKFEKNWSNVSGTFIQGRFSAACCEVTRSVHHEIHNITRKTVVQQKKTPPINYLCIRVSYNMLSTLSIEEAVAYDDVCQQEVAYVLTIGAQSTDRTPRAGHIQCNTGDRWKAESSMSIDKTTAVPYPWGYF